MENKQTSEQKKTHDKFNPLIFLAPLGAGGISVSFFSFINYTLEHGKGLINFNQTHLLSSGVLEIFYSLMDFGMIVFALIHFYLMIKYLPILFKWIKTDEYKNNYSQNPLINSGILTPFIALTMTMNVFLASIRYFTPWMANNLQSLIVPGLIGWTFLWLFLMRLEIKLLTTAFKNGFDIDKINFGWLLHSFALAMVTVTGTGISALSQAAMPAHIAFFMVLVSGSMGLFLFLVKIVTVFKKHFEAPGLPDKQFLPSILIAVPNITLYAISFFRIGHYFEKNFLHEATLAYPEIIHGFMKIFFTTITLGAFAFETWYLIFGLFLLKDYFKNDFTKEFHISQWGLICPFVSYAVIGTFADFAFINSNIFTGFLAVVILFTVILYLYLLKKQIICQKKLIDNILCN
jgi:hypothetical protein